MVPDNGRVTAATADLRWSRAVVTAAIAVGLGAWAHAVAGGLLPGVVGLLLVGGTLTVLFAAALGRPASYALLAVLVAGGQTLVHLVLTAVSGHSGADGHEAGPPPTLGHAVEHLRDDLSGPHLAMALAHLTAAAAVAAWLHVGEQALWAVIALLGTALVRRLLAVSRASHPIVVPRPVAAPTATPLPLVSRLLMSGPIARRGPPVLLAALPAPTS